MHLCSPRMFTPFQLEVGMVYTHSFARTQDGKPGGYAASDSTEGACAELGEIRRPLVIGRFG